MKRTTLMIAFCLSVAALGLPTSSSAHDAGQFDKHGAGKLFPSKPPYSPYAGRIFPTRPYFGDTHLHTA